MFIYIYILHSLGFAAHTVYMALHEAKNDEARALEILTHEVASHELLTKSQV